MKPNTTFESFIPYSSHIAPDVVRTVGGEYLMTWRLDGVAHIGIDSNVLNHRHDVLNRWVQSLRAPDSSNISLWTHEFRTLENNQDSRHDTGSEFVDHLSAQYERKLSGRPLFRTEHFLTLVLRPLQRKKQSHSFNADITIQVSKLHELASMLEQVLHDYGPTRLGIERRAEAPDVSMLAGFLARFLNGVNQAPPVVRAPLHTTLATASIQFAADASEWSIRMPTGKRKFGAMIGIKEFTDRTSPGALNVLQSLPFEYVLTQSFSPLGRHQALRSLERTKGRLISVGDKSVSQIRELDEAMDQLSSGAFLFGEHHCSLAVLASSRKELTQHAAEACAALTDLGFIATRETLGTVPAFWAQLPANWKYRPRIRLLSSRNFVGLSSFQRGARGKANGNPWGSSIASLRSASGERFHFNFHATTSTRDDTGEMALGNTLVIGKSGTGKTALVNFLLAMSQNLKPAPRLFLFDKDHGAALFVTAMGGRHFGLRKGVPSGLNPLQMPPVPGRVAFLADWIRILADRESLSPVEERELHQAIEAILDAEPHLRTISNLRRSLPNRGDECLFARLRKWTAGQPLGWVFDNPHDLLNVESHSIFAFDYTEVLDDPLLRIPVIQYLLFRLESIIDGCRLIYVMDEFWKILEGESGLRDFARNKQKTIRKQNGLGIFATQSPEDALRSPVATAIIEQTATMLLLPNPNATRTDYVDGLKLTEEEFELVKSLGEHSRRFLVKQGTQCALCELDLSGLTDILAVLSSTTASVTALQNLPESQSGFREWLPVVLEQVSHQLPTTLEVV